MAGGSEQTKDRFYRPSSERAAQSAQQEYEQAKLNFGPKNPKHPDRPIAVPRTLKGSSSELASDNAASQDDFIGFEKEEPKTFDPLDGPGPTSEAQDRARHDRPKFGTAQSQPPPPWHKGAAGHSFPQPDQRSAPKSMPILYPLPIPAWQPKDRVYSKDLLMMLNEEIEDYIGYLVPTEAEHFMRQMTVDRIRETVLSVFPRAKVTVFGSFETKLYLPSSDVDLVVMDPSAKGEALQKLKRALQSRNICSKIDVIASAKVPIIKMVDSLTNYPADISFNVDGGIRAAKIVKTFIEDPLYGAGLRPLLLIMKQFLLQRGLNEVFTGGMGSYALMCLIVAFLKMHPLLQTRQMKASENLGVLLLEFLEFYGIHFNYRSMGIGLDHKDVWYFTKESVQRRCPFPRIPRPEQLCLVDPNDLTNELGGATKTWPIIRNAFQSAASLIIAMIGVGSEPRNKHVHVPTLLGSILTVRRNVIEHRESIQQRYDEVVGKMPDDDEDSDMNVSEGETHAPSRPLDAPAVAIHRKRNISDDEEGFVFVSADSEDEDANYLEELASGGKGKKARRTKKRRTR
ncbi:hypothetical protein HKX48_003554 [Thoreauomyces humboldtii]|nr:hypothetical protein HKX48_003554 [Thoreauomyces humboldtii]